MNLCSLLIYCAVSPGRVKEYISLRIYKDQSGDKLKGQDFFWFKEDSAIILLENNYKTRKTYRLNTTDLSPFKYLNYYLQPYNSKLRSLLLHEKTSFKNYMSGLFKKYLSLRLTTVDRRKIVVDCYKQSLHALLISVVPIRICSF